MRHLTTSRWATGLASFVAVSSLALAFGTGTAMALPPLPTPTSGVATANALEARLAGGSLISTGTVRANAAIPTPTPGNQGTGLLGLLSAGVLSQSAQLSTSDGSTAACAGLTGPNGLVTIGNNGVCSVTGVTAGVTITLGATTITADAIVESCSFPKGGSPSANLQLLNARIDGGAVLNSSPPPNTHLLNLLNVIVVNANTQATTLGAGISARGLTVTLVNSLGGADLVDLDIGTVTCGTPAAVPLPVFPLKSLPIAGGTALLLAAIVVPWYRRRRRTA